MKRLLLAAVIALISSPVFAQTGLGTPVGHEVSAGVNGYRVRHLSNGVTGVSGYRTDNYLYLPVGLTARTHVASHNALSFNLEYDRLLHGWQKTRDSELGGGDVPATPTALAFTIEGFSDISFAQHGGVTAQEQLGAYEPFNTTNEFVVKVAFHF